MPISTAARYLRKSTQFVRKQINRYNETKMVDDLQSQGSRRKQDDRPNIRGESYGNVVSNSTLARAKTNLGQSDDNETKTDCLWLWISQYSDFLSESHIEKRWQWAAENIDRDFSNVVFTDEASFWACNTHKRAQSIRGKPRIQCTDLHPLKVYVWEKQKE